MHDPFVLHFFFTNDGYIIFGLARNNTSTATCTLIQVNSQSPVKSLIFRFFIQCNCFLFIDFVQLISCIGFFFPLIQNSFPHNWPSFHRMIGLCCSQRICFPCFFNGNKSLVKLFCIIDQLRKRENIFSNIIGNFTSICTAIAHGN